MSDYLPYLPPGWTHWQTVGEYNALGAAVAGIPKALHGKAVVEIGAGTGISTRIICDALEAAENPAPVTTVDSLRVSTDKILSCTDGQFESQSDAIESCIEPHRKRVDFWTMTSMQALNQWKEKPRSIALLHIDGHHKLPYVREDLRWAEHVARHGLLVMHDIGKSVTPDWGPTGAFIEWMVERTDWRQIVQAQSLLVMQRMK